MKILKTTLLLALCAALHAQGQTTNSLTLDYSPVRTIGTVSVDNLDDIVLSGTGNNMGWFAFATPVTLGADDTIHVEYTLQNLEGSDLSLDLGTTPNDGFSSELATSDGTLIAPTRSSVLNELPGFGTTLFSADYDASAVGTPDFGQIMLRLYDSGSTPANLQISGVNVSIISPAAAPVPEPCAMALAGLGGFGMLVWRWKLKRK